MLTYLRIMITARTQRGASAVEYGLLVAGIAVVLLVVGPALGDVLAFVFNETNSNLESTPGTN